MEDIKKDPFEEYIKNLPPTRKELGQAWQAAIGLQDVDGLKPSEYLYETAKKNIDGEISVDEAGDLINSYYESKDGRSEVETRTEEADKVSARIAKILSEKAFTFSPTQYLSIHRELFLGIYSHAGKIRDYNITKKEWVLDGDTVSYGGATELRETLDYDFSQERDFRYNGLTMDEVIHHLAVFISRLWQIHVFEEGNTRTTAVFLIKYLRMLGFDAENDLFAEHSWYFRNALVRTNYNNIKNGIYETTEFFEMF
jgi:fido (protein-threonine AMPylation protein)